MDVGGWGKQSWKVTCVCGKRLITPAPTTHPYGRCPKCSRRLLLPGYAGAANEEDAPAKSTADEMPADDKNVAVKADHPAAGEAAEAVKRVSLRAALTAADRLRPHRPSARTVAKRTASGRISAWPLAGKGRRFLAAFIDLSLCGGIAGVVLVLAGKDVLAPLCSPLQTLLATLLLALVFNDSVIHLIWGGSVGKKLVLIVVRDENGQDCGPLRVLLRAVLKWLLIPGWIIGAFDSAERTVHDLFAGTLVLRGRRRPEA